MKKSLIRITENDLHRIIEHTIHQVLKEDGEIGGTSTFGVNGDNSGDQSFGVAYLAFGKDKEACDRKGGKNHSISMNHVDEDTDVISKPIYQPRKR